MDNTTPEGINIALFAILLAVGLVLFVVSLITRVRTGGKYDIRPIDIVLVLIPVVLWLFGTGKITKFNIAGVEIETAKAFLVATEKPIIFSSFKISETLADDMKENIGRARKEGVDKIPELIKKKTEALEFQIGYGGYWGPAIEKYFEILSAAGFLKYVLIYDKEGILFGVYDSQALLLHLQNRGEEGYRLFAENLNNTDRESNKALQRLPGFVSISDAVTPKSNKRTALEAMEDLNSDILPVVDKEFRFIGMVDRSKITTSLIIDVTRAMEELSTKNESN